MLRVAGSLHSRQSGSPEGRCAGGATWHFTTSSTNLASRLAYLNCISTAWGFAFACYIHPKVRNKLEYFMYYLSVVVCGEVNAHIVSKAHTSYPASTISLSVKHLTPCLSCELTSILMW